MFSLRRHDTEDSGADDTINRILHKKRESMSDVVIRIRKDSLWKYSTFILAALLIITLFYFMSDGSGEQTGNVVQQLPGKQAAVNVGVDDDAVLGESDAPVTIIEFSDYECPFCGRHYRETYPLLKKNYIESGKVKLVFRDFPLNFHPNAFPAAVAAECVRKQGGDVAYWKMHDAIFENQQAISPSQLTQLASGLGYNIQQCLSSNTYKDEVEKDMADGSSAGVSGTPAFIINKKLISGACPYSTFEQAIGAELASKAWSVANCQVTVG